MSLASGHTYEHLEDELQQQYNKDLPGALNDVIRLQPNGWILAKNYLRLQEMVYNFQVNDLHFIEGLKFILSYSSLSCRLSKYVI